MSILVDIDEAKNFIDTLHPELNDNEVLLFLLDARKKYFPEITSKDRMIQRKVLKKKEYTDRLLYEICSVEDRYMYEGGFIPKEAFVLYMVLNPCDIIKAYFKLQEDMNQLLYQVMKRDENALYNFKKVHVHWFSALHRSRAKLKYWLIDIDEKDEELLKYVLQFGFEVKWISETRGGYHIIIPVNDENGKILFRDKVLSKLEKVELKKNAMTPVVGTMQGGVLVRKYKRRLDEFL